jgi:hypothetical protein
MSWLTKMVTEWNDWMEIMAQVRADRDRILDRMGYQVQE